MKQSLSVKDKSENNKFLKASAFRKNIKKTEPHKHDNYFEIIYLSKGSGLHCIDYNRFVIQPPVVFFVRKEQVHYWDVRTEPEGYVLILKKEFIERSLDGELKSLLTRVSNVSSLQLNHKETINQLFELITIENKLINENNFPLLEGLLKALLAKMLEVAKPVINKTAVRPDLFQAFRELLSQHRVIKNSVAHFARLLNTSPQNLNATCRRAVNQSAATVLAEFIISEAKRLLIYTDNTVSEVSFSLSFNDPSHFVKYFKRFTGHTPQAFRSL
jgi:AraC family transcriptional regulator, transcriptional activator of pobA